MTAQGDGDWLSFQGATYFRTAGGQNQYGISARAVAVDTALADSEEFPAFTEFWIEPVSDQAVRIYALIDGPSLTGAMRIESTHGPEGVVQDVTTVFAMRRDIGRLGIAPASSMFWYDQNSPDRTQDWRPEIHDPMVWRLSARMASISGAPCATRMTRAPMPLPSPIRAVLA
jgi:glucans biosynthesis protein